MTIFGTSGNNHRTGTAGIDEFDMSQGGNDTVSGLESDDTFLFGAELTKRDAIDGGAGNDTVTFDGDYSSGVKFDSTTFTSVEILVLAAGHDYDLTTVDANLTPTYLYATIDASGLGAGDRFTFDGHRETDTVLFIHGGAGDDTVTGGNLSNTFYFDGGGADTGTGGSFGDSFFMGGAFDSHDQLDGGDGSDAITLVGDYSAGLTITNAMIDSIDRLSLSGAFNYDITFEDKAVHAGTTFLISTVGPLGGFDVSIDASREKDSAFHFNGGAADETFLGGDEDDEFSVGAGTDHDEGGHGDDLFYAYVGFGADDVVEGGQGYDTLMMYGHDLTSVVLGADTLDSIEAITFNYPYSYSLTLDDGNVDAGDILLIDASAIEAGQTLTFDGSAETDGTFFMYGGAGDDTLTGGALGDTIDGSAGADRLNGYLGDDILVGGNGADRFNGGVGADHYVINFVAESTSTTYDRTLSFDTLEDAFDLPDPVAGIDARATNGPLSAGSFDTDLAAAIGASQLAAGHAVIFVPNAGDLAGERFLIIEYAGGAGYQAGLDYVVQLTHIAHINQLSVDNFI